MFSGDMAERWRELHGSEHWEGLLDPLDVDLRRCLITYGEMIMATYEAFIAESRSPNAGMCRSSVPPRRPFRARGRVPPGLVRGHPVHLRHGLRRRARQGTPPAALPAGAPQGVQLDGVRGRGHGRGRRDIVVAWRGTQRVLEWVADMKLALASAAGILGPQGADGSVHRGYLSLYTSADEVSKLSKHSARMQVCFFFF
jgi:hypothetical protein